MSEIPSDFHRERMTGIGGADAAAAIGISPWRTPYDLWREKIGEVEPIPGNEPMYWGTLLEPVIIAEYTRRTGRGVFKPTEVLRHDKFSWMMAHLDGHVLGTRNRIVEVKTARSARGWGEAGTDEVPLHYLIQCHHYLSVADAAVADVAVLIGGSDFRIYEIARDQEIEAAIISEERLFWESVLQREPPPPVNYADAIQRWGRLATPGQVIASETEMAAIEKLRLLRDTRSELEAAETEAKLIVLQALGDSGDRLVDTAGTLLASWHLDSGRKAYTVGARDPQRRFLLK